MAVLRSNQLTIGSLFPQRARPRAATWIAELWTVPANHRAILREIVIWSYHADQPTAFVTVRVWSPESFDVILFSPKHITDQWTYTLACNTVLQPGDRLAMAGNPDEFRWLFSGALLPIP